MRGLSDPQSDLFSYVSLESRVPADHPLRRFRQLVDVVLASMDDELSALYSRVGRPSIPPEHLLRVESHSSPEGDWCVSWKLYDFRGL